MSKKSYTVSGFPATNEQFRAIEAGILAQQRGASLKLEAGAGCSKTSTLIAMSHELQGKGFYLAFNKMIADEAAVHFGGRITAKTGHALAFRTHGAPVKNNLVNRLVPGMLVEALNLQPMGAFSAEKMSAITIQTLRRFCGSVDEKISYNHLPPFNAGGFDDKAMVSEQILLIARKYWRDSDRVEAGIPITHDVYFKKWAMSHPELPGDYVLLDEGQDTSDVLLDVLSRQEKPTIVVGDEFQAIYSWRNAVNAMKKLDADYVATLTKSFRYGDDIADMANKVLAHHCKTDFRVRGFEQVSSAVKALPIAKPDTVICRTNAGGMREMMERIQKGEPARFIGDTRALIDTIKAVEDLKQRGRSGHPELRHFQSYDDLVAYSEGDDGQAYRSLLNMIDTHGGRSLQRTIEQAGRAGENPNFHGVTVVTAHKSKGMEWDNVVLGDDFVFPDSKRFTGEEGNLLYVAVTRARKNLDISRSDKLCKLYATPIAEQKFSRARTALDSASTAPSSAEDNWPRI